MDKYDLPSGYLLWQLSNIWQKKLNQALKPYDLTHFQFMCLISIQKLHNQGKLITQKDLATQINSDTMMVSNTLRLLEKKNLIVRKLHPEDTRARSLYLTDEGREKLNEVSDKVLDRDRSFFQSLGAKATDFNLLIQQIIDEN